jgi:hypothetical protein
MRNRKGSKSAQTQKLETPAEGGKPEVTLANGTVAVLPNPGDAPPPPPKRPGKKKKAAPTVVTNAPTAARATEVPDWAKRAAAHDTPAEMAAVSEVVTSAAEPGPEAPVAAAKRGRKPKAGAPAPEPGKADAPAATPGSLRAIGNAWIDHLRADGHSVSTVASYGNDLEVAYEHLGGDVAAAGLTERQIQGFNGCALVLRKKSGKPKAQPTILKTRRALRLALVWAAEQKLIAKAPYPAA